MSAKDYSDKLSSFEKDQQNHRKRLTTTISGTALPSYTPFRGRSNSAPQGMKKPGNKKITEQLSIKHGTSEMASNIVRFHVGPCTAITMLNRKIKRNNLQSVAETTISSSATNLTFVK